MNEIYNGIGLTYRAPAHGVRGLVPPDVELVEDDGDAFWDIRACRTRWGPGLDWLQVSYRLRVRAGLYAVRSDVGSRLLAAAGLWARPRLQRSRIRFTREIGVCSLEVDSGDGRADVRFYADVTAADPFVAGRAITVLHAFWAFPERLARGRLRLVEAGRPLSARIN